MRVPTIGVLALQGDVREHLRALPESGASAVPVRRPTELDAVDGLVIPGGESTTIGKLAAAFELTEPLRKRIARRDAGVRVLRRDDHARRPDRWTGAPGQETLGGLDVTVRRNAFGRQVDSFEANIEIADRRQPFHAVFIRAPWVESVGAGVEVLGGPRTSTAPWRPGRPPVGSSRCGRAVCWPPSFHPELAGDLRVHALFVQMVKEHDAGGHDRPLQVGDDEAQEGRRSTPSAASSSPS